MSAPQPGQPQPPQPGGGINFLPSTDAIRKVLTSQVTPNAIHWFGMSFVIVVILWLITYVTTKINLGKTVRVTIRPGNKYKGWDVELADINLNDIN